MALFALDTPELIDLVSSWLSRDEDAKWLDFGNGVRAPSPAVLKIMTQRGINLLRVYTDEAVVEPAGVAGLSNIDPRFKTAWVWAVLGVKRHGGCTVGAVSALLTEGFTELGLRSIAAWTLDVNHAARRVLERLEFRYVGRQRQCHYLDGEPHDRLLYDLLPDEHEAARERLRHQPSRIAIPRSASSRT